MTRKHKKAAHKHVHCSKDANKERDMQTIKEVNDALDRKDLVRLRKLSCVMGLVNHGLRERCWGVLCGADGPDNSVTHEQYLEWADVEHRDKHVVRVDVERSLFNLLPDAPPEEIQAKRQQLQRLLNAVIGRYCVFDNGDTQQGMNASETPRAGARGPPTPSPAAGTKPTAASASPHSPGSFRSSEGLPEDAAHRTSGDGPGSSDSHASGTGDELPPVPRRRRTAGISCLGGVVSGRPPTLSPRASSDSVGMPDVPPSSASRTASFKESVRRSFGGCLGGPMPVADTATGTMAMQSLDISIQGAGAMQQIPNPLLASNPEQPGSLTVSRLASCTRVGGQCSPWNDADGVQGDSGMGRKETVNMAAAGDAFGPLPNGSATAFRLGHHSVPRLSLQLVVHDTTQGSVPSPLRASITVHEPETPRTDTTQQSTTKHHQAVDAEPQAALQGSFSHGGSGRPDVVPPPSQSAIQHVQRHHHLDEDDGRAASTPLHIQDIKEEHPHLPPSPPAVPAPPAAAPPVAPGPRPSSQLVYYYQGLHDIASILLLVCGSEHAAFPLLSRLVMCQLRDATRSALHPIMEVLSLLYPLLNIFDAPLARHLQAHDLPPFFALSWLITWFSHDLKSVSTAARLFDVFLGSHPLMPLYVGVAAMLGSREAILECTEMPELHTLLVNLKISEYISPHKQRNQNTRSGGASTPGGPMSPMARSHSTTTRAPICNGNSPLSSPHRTMSGGGGEFQYGGTVTVAVTQAIDDLIVDAYRLYGNMPPTKLIKQHKLLLTCSVSPVAELASGRTWVVPDEGPDAGRGAKSGKARGSSNGGGAGAGLIRFFKQLTSKGRVDPRGGAGGYQLRGDANAERVSAHGRGAMVDGDGERQMTERVRTGGSLIGALSITSVVGVYLLASLLSYRFNAGAGSQGTMM